MSEFNSLNIYTFTKVNVQAKRQKLDNFDNSIFCTTFDEISVFEIK